MKLKAISLSPNVFLDDALLSLRYLLSPRRWFRGDSVAKLENLFRKRLGVKHAFGFASGRTALRAILKGLSLGPEDEVLLQAFTCVAVPEAVLAVGAGPVYVDVDETLNLDPKDLERKITSRSRAVIIQHTFGVPAKIEEVLILAKKYGLAVIEDCAHSLGARYKGREVGTFGRAAFFSFGRDKVVSSVFGGVAATNDESLGRRLGKLRSGLPEAPPWWVAQQLFHPVAFSFFIIPFYYFFGWGKVFHFALRKLGALSQSVYDRERQGAMPKVLLTKLPEALAALALLQMGKLAGFNRHRRKLARIYFKALKDLDCGLPLFGGEAEPVFLRFNLLTDRAREVALEAKKEGFILGDWYPSVIAPRGVDLEALGYRLGSCPRAESLSRLSLNLPTGPKMAPREAEDLARIITRCLTSGLEGLS